MRTVSASTKLPALLLTLWAGHFLVDFMLGIWPAYKTMVELDLAKAGLIMGLGAILGEGAQVFAGPWSDRGFTRTLVALGILLAGTAACFPYFTNYKILAILFVMTYLGSGCFHPSASGWLGTLSSKRRNLLMGLFSSGGSLGLALGQVTFTWTYVHAPSYVFMLMMPCLLLALGIAYFMSSPAQNPTLLSASTPKRSLVADFLPLFRHRPLVLIYVLLVANHCFAWATIFLLPDVLKEKGFETWICYGAGHLCFILGGAVTAIPFGYLADRTSERLVLLGCVILASSLCYLFLFSGSLSEGQVLLLLFAAGAFLGVVNPVSVALGVSYFPESPGRVSAMLMGLVFVVAEGLGPLSAGLLTKCFTTGAAAKALACIGVLFLLELFCVLRLPHRRRATTALETPVNAQ